MGPGPTPSPTYLLHIFLGPTYVLNIFGHGSRIQICKTCKTCSTNMCTHQHSTRYRRRSKACSRLAPVQAFVSNRVFCTEGHVSTSEYHIGNNIHS